MVPGIREMKLFSKKSSEDNDAIFEPSIFDGSNTSNLVEQSEIPSGEDASSNQSDDLQKQRLFRDIKKMEFSREAEIFKALGHPIRLKIVYGLLKVGGCNVKNMQECLGLHQATVSQHLIHLKSRGIITSERQGLEMVYTVNNNWAKCVIDNIEKNQKDPKFQ